MRIKRIGLSGVIFFAIVSIFQGCTILGTGTQQPTRNYVLNSVYSDETQPKAVTDLHDIGILVGPIRMAIGLTLILRGL